jgi:hypothetical protein
MLGVQSAATVELENSSRTPRPFQTAPTTHLGFAAVLGFDYQVNQTLSVPLEFRATWDPFVADNTRDRLESYTSMNRYGAYRVAYDWQLFFMTGLRYDL